MADLEAEEDVWLNADFHKLSTVLRNMLSTAIKFTPRGGRVTLQVSVVNSLASGESAIKQLRTVSTNRNEQLLMFSVTDSGAGLSKASSTIYIFI